MIRLKKNTKRTIFIMTSLILIMGGAFTAFHWISTKQARTAYEEEVAVLSDTISSNTKKVLIATTDIKYGQVIKLDDVREVNELASFDASMFMTSADIGAVARVDIPTGTVITINMFTHEDFANTLRETQFDVLVLNSNLTNGDFVDVRIRYKNGEDYVVLSKKRVKNLSLRNAVCYMDLIEEETQLISSAIVDAGVYEAILYTTTYLEPSIQEPSVVTYQPSADVLNLICNSPNILQIATENLSATARAEMQQRLSAYENSILNNGVAGDVFNVTDTPNIEDMGNMQNDPIEEDLDNNSSGNE